MPKGNEFAIAVQWSAHVIKIEPRKVIEPNYSWTAECLGRSKRRCVWVIVDPGYPRSVLFVLPKMVADHNTLLSTTSALAKRLQLCIASPIVRCNHCFDTSSLSYSWEVTPLVRSMQLKSQFYGVVDHRRQRFMRRMSLAVQHNWLNVRIGGSIWSEFVQGFVWDSSQDLGGTGNTNQQICKLSCRLWRSSMEGSDSGRRSENSKTLKLVTLNGIFGWSMSYGTCALHSTVLPVVLIHMLIEAERANDADNYRSV